MIVLDTHAWLWLVADTSQLSVRARRAVAAATQLGVPAISIWEVAMPVQRGRIRLDRAIDEWVSDALSMAGMHLCPVTPSVAIAAAGLTAMHGDPAGHLIAATAMVGGWRLITCDRKLRAHSDIDTVW